jgi:hypothetical protein
MGNRITDEQGHKSYPGKLDVTGLRAKAWQLALLGAMSGFAYYMLVSLSLTPKSGLAYDVKGMKYGGPLTWPSRWFGLAHLSPGYRQLLFVFLMAALSGLWFGAIYIVRRDTRRSLTVIIAAAFGLFALIFVFSPAFISRDIFSNIFFGRAMTVYHSNPFLLIPHVRPHDLFYPLIGWKYNASVYGPVFNYLSWVVTKIAGNNIASNVLGFKVLNFVFYAACLPMVYWLTKRITPGRENMALAITAWCPILVMHALGGAHNDIIMVALVLAGYLLYRKGYLLTGIVVVLVATLVKITGVFALAPMLVLYIRDKEGSPLKRLIAAGATCIGVAVLLYLPFLQSLKIFKTTGHMSSMYTSSSVPRLFSWVYVKAFGGGGGAAAARLQLTANSRVHLLFLGVAGILGILLLIGVKDYHSMVSCAAALVLVWFFTSAYILPWYLGLGLALAAITGWNMTTGVLVGASTVFTLYHIPSTSGSGPLFYLSVPLLLLFVIWAIVLGNRKVRTSRWFLGRS